MFVLALNKTVALSHKKIPQALSCGVFQWRCVMASGQGVQFGHTQVVAVWLTKRKKEKKKHRRTKSVCP